MALGNFSSNLAAVGTGDVTSASTLALLACVTIVSALAVREFWSWYRLKHVPGPFWAGFSILYMNKQAMSGRMSSVFKELGEKFGE